MQVEVKNSTKKLCVIGEPVLHSKSPLIQNTMLAALGLDYVYLCQPVPRGRCREWLECAKFAGYAGFNATMPHKEELVELMDELDGDARLFGAVNTVCIRDGRAYGYNTDGRLSPRPERRGHRPAGSGCWCWGPGGRPRRCASSWPGRGGGGSVQPHRGQGRRLCATSRPACAPPASTRIPCGGRRRSAGCWSTAPLWVWRGRSGSLRSSLFWTPCPPGAPVVDLIYAPAETELLRRAREGGHQTANGFGLLVNQAVLSLEHFTGTAIDAAEMKRRLADVLLP